MKGKKLIIAIIIFLLLFSIGIFFYIGNKKKVNLDFKVPNYYSLANYNYDGDFNKFYSDIYNWYKSIENEDGVYIINTSYSSDELLNAWKDNNVYKTIPNKAFWEFTVSPTYLKEINIEVEQEEIENAINGVRLYLVPDTLNDEEFSTMKSYLEEMALYEVDSSLIKTNFVNDKKIEVIKYSPKDSYFTWQSQKGDPITDNAPIIYVCTANNMKYFESESLIATGVDSYIKFKDKETMEQFINKEELKNYHLNFMTSNKIYKKASRSKLVDSGIDSVFE